MLLGHVLPSTKREIMWSIPYLDQSIESIGLINISHVYFYLLIPRMEYIKEKHPWKWRQISSSRISPVIPRAVTRNPCESGRVISKCLLLLLLLTRLFSSFPKHSLNLMRQYHDRRAERGDNDTLILHAPLDLQHIGSAFLSSVIFIYDAQMVAGSPLSLVGLVGFVIPLLWCTFIVHHICMHNTCMCPL